MDVIQSANKQVDKFGTGLHGFNLGNPGLGVLATTISEVWCDDVQMEIVNVLLAAGIAPAAATRTQLRDAINLLARLPAGAVFHFAMSSAPTGFLKANGANISRSSYAALFAAIGTTYGAGDGSSTFTLPDLRGEFLRGWDDGRGVDSGRVIGSSQAHATAAQSGSVNATPLGDFGPFNTGSASGVFSLSNALGNRMQGSGGSGSSSTLSINVGTPGATETRSRNIALLACIKF